MHTERADAPSGARSVLLVCRAPARQQLLALAEALVRRGHDVALAWDKRNAERLMADKRPDIIMLDSELGLKELPRVAGERSSRTQPRLMLVGPPSRVHRFLRAVATSSGSRESGISPTPAH
jgi:DNA-binding response OmpR family regulator